MDDLERQQQQDEREWENTDNWRFGLFYFGERDSRLWVPKRSMLSRRRSGGTPNLARPETRRFLKMLAGFFLFIFMAMLLLQRLGVIP